MVRLELTPEQCSLLLDMLECCLTDLRVEIRETDRFEYKNMLKDRKEEIALLQEYIRQALQQ
ncbi:MAG TPA: hypothetical protein PKJ34_04335 [Anaerolineaceae bacterium]|nr:hypothetical protein [Anaerolineaceae bacterium]